jgi:hypothetical protein
MKLIESKTLATDAASIEFTSIPQDATDLLFVLAGRSTIDNIEWYLQFNGDTGSNYTVRRLRGTGSAVTSTTNTLTGLLFQGITSSSVTANTFGNAAVYILNYTGSTTKVVSCDEVFENNATAGFQTISSGIWSGTGAITSLKLPAAGGNFAAGTTASLYKITKGSDGIVTTS